MQLSETATLPLLHRSPSQLRDRTIDCTFKREGDRLRDNASYTTAARRAGQLLATAPAEALLAAHHPVVAKAEETFPLLPNAKTPHRHFAQRLQFIRSFIVFRRSRNYQSNNLIRRSIDCTFERDSARLRDNACSAIAARCAGQLSTAGPDEALLAARHPGVAEQEEAFPILPNAKAAHRRCAQRL